MANSMKRYGAPSVKKAFAILSAISSSKEGLGVSELARGLSMAKSTVHGMTSALEEVGYQFRVKGIQVRWQYHLATNDQKPLFQQRP